ncbi:MAG TPA: TIGR03086 family metal-binding protein [Chloroflexota bacterium]|jgi:uncharacterized protein (TIGR03086 family)
MDPIALFQRTLADAERTVASVSPDELRKPTPCSDWTVQQVVEHMTGTNWAFTRAVSGQAAPGAQGAPAAGGDAPAAAYAASARAALAAWQTPGALEKTLNLPFGQMPGAQAIGFNIGDQLMHTWDVAKATGRDRTLDPEATAVVFERVQQVLTPEARGPGRPFGVEQPCPPDAPIHDRLAAFLGRSVT